MILNYWKAECLDDHDCYSIRETTKKEVLARLTERKCMLIDGQYEGPDSKYTTPFKVQIEYKSGFDLLSMCLDEGGVGWVEGKNRPAYRT
jgi:hypothetical protein